MESARSKVRESLNRLLGHTWATRLPGMLLISSTVLLLVYSAFAAGLKPGVMNLDGALTDKRSDTCTPEYTAGLDEEFISENGCPSVVQAHVSLDSINLGARKEAALRVRLYPDGDLGMSLQNGGVLFGGTLLSFESTGENNHYLDADVWANAQTATVPLKSNGTAANYPFDAYRGQWSVLLQSSETGETLPLWLTAAKAEVAGFDVAMNKVDQPEDMGETISANTVGFGQLNFSIKRSSSDIFQVILLLFVLLIGAASAAITTWAVINKNRPPSLGILAWLATYLFSLIQVRNQLPGNPAIGLHLDRFFTFPAIAMVLIFILMNAIGWLRRDDWDMGNADDDKTVDVAERVG